MSETALCVGGPLHGLRRQARGATFAQLTWGGPDDEGMLTHVYTACRMTDGRLVLRWRMIPRWNRAGFTKPKE